jgi:hypothetical protein
MTGGHFEPFAGIARPHPLEKITEKIRTKLASRRRWFMLTVKVD